MRRSESLPGVGMKVFVEQQKILPVRRGGEGRHWKDLLLFYEYFHADTGQGLGAAHQTGWTGLLANLVMRRYRKDIPEFWSRQSVATNAASRERPKLRVA